MSQLFDMQARRARRERAAWSGFDPFLHARAFAEGIDRLADVARQFDRALIIGCPDPSWPELLRGRATDIVAVDPSPRLAAMIGGVAMEETDIARLEGGKFDLVIAAGTLHAVDALPQALLAMRHLMADDALLIGAMAGGHSLPMLRDAMLAADRAEGRGATPRVHPRVDAPTLATLLTKAGFVMPVVDIDRVTLRYRSLAALVRDLRAIGETNILVARDRQPLTRRGLAAASAAFAAQADDDGRTIERIDLLHFAAWTEGPR